jgi:hypothetical protein
VVIMNNYILCGSTCSSLLSLICPLPLSNDASFVQLTGYLNIFQLFHFSVPYCNLNSAMHNNLFHLKPTALKTWINATSNGYGIVLMEIVQYAQTGFSS